MRNIRFVVRYDGTDFAGWQRQPGLRTVEETLETAVREITREPRLRPNVSGRTDAGVHAVGQVVNFYTTTRLACDKLLNGVNSQLPGDVKVWACDDVPQSFCANKDAVRKTYRYVVNDGGPADPFLRRYAAHCWHPLDVAAMGRAATCWVGRHDFRCFETEWPNRMSSVRTVFRIDVARAGGTVTIDAEADGFLYNMVRAIAGTLIRIGRGYWPESQAAAILTAGDRRLAGPTAPAAGLFLMRVTYPNHLKLQDESPSR
ncbi:MAG: tRNA pseudouridine(38-40) synthase TruA [Fimbriiglobus sp.]